MKNLITPMFILISQFIGAQQPVSFYFTDSNGNPIYDTVNIKVVICDSDNTVVYEEDFISERVFSGYADLVLGGRDPKKYKQDFQNYYDHFEYGDSLVPNNNLFAPFKAKVSFPTANGLVAREFDFYPNTPYALVKGDINTGVAVTHHGMDTWEGKTKGEYSGGRISLTEGDNGMALSPTTWDIYGTNRSVEYDGTNLFFGDISSGNNLSLGVRGVELTGGDHRTFFDNGSFIVSSAIDFRDNKINPFGYSIEKDNKLKMFSGWSTSANNYLSTIINKNDKPVALTSINSNHAGVFSLYNPTGNSNIVMNTISGSEGNRPLIYLYRPGNTSPEVALYINDNNQGVIQADVKNFRMDHPADESLDIVYASLEGPEAAAYVRGNATLQQGKVYIRFPDHFIHVCGPESLTVQLTPRSKDSKGLAVTSIDTGGFWVEELGQGKGNYAFFWEAKGVRNGYENYQVIQPKSRLKAAEVNLPKYK